MKPLQPKIQNNALKLSKCTQCCNYTANIKLIGTLFFKMEHLGLIFQTLKNCKQSSNKVVLFLFIITSLAVLVCTDEDYYKLLGLTKSATNRQIRQAFKKLALTMHPDKNPVSRIVLIRIFKCSLIDILCWIKHERNEDVIQFSIKRKCSVLPNEISTDCF